MGVIGRDPHRVIRPRDETLVDAGPVQVCPADRVAAEVGPIDVGVVRHRPGRHVAPSDEASDGSLPSRLERPT